MLLVCATLRTLFKFPTQSIACGIRNYYSTLWRQAHSSRSPFLISCTALRRQLLFICSRQRPLYPHQVLVHSRSLFGKSMCNLSFTIAAVVVVGADSELSIVKTELDKISRGNDKETSTQQLALFKSLTRDVSEPTTTLVAKLNCETKRENLNHK